MNHLARPTRPVLLRGPSDPGLLRDERLHEVFVASGRRDPGRVALRAGGDRLRYGELDALTDRWARALRRRGVGPGAIVGVWLDRSIALHAAVLAVLKAGAAFLPFDADAPEARVRLCLADCDAGFLLADAAHAGAARRAAPRPAGEAGRSAAVLDLARIDADGDASRDPAPPRPRADAAAYVIYTSGTTGRPKGVAVSHRSICHLLRAENAVLGVVASDVVHAGFSAAFDMSLEEVFLSYLAGAEIVVSSALECRDVERLPALLARAGVTVLHGVPTLLGLLDDDLDGVRLINVGGEACPPALVSRLWRPWRRIVNTYGPTETTVTATAAVLRPGEPVTIGTLLPNYTATILDPDGDPVRPGDAGELCIGGPGVALGYVGRPALTAERFAPLPGGLSDADPPFYRTGDRASLDDAGRLVLHGRLDGQVKLRGYRIELGEIEAVLGGVEGVRAAAVAPPGEGPDARLVAFLVSDRPCDPRALRAALSARLPDYMVPHEFRDLDALPLLPSGKLDRAALAALASAAAAAADDDEHDRASGAGAAAPIGVPAIADPDGGPDPVLALMRGLFPGAAVGPDDDFFTGLGGHSLLAATLVSRLRARQPRFAAVSLRDLYELRTARALADRFPAAAAAAPTPAPGPDIGAGADRDAPAGGRRRAACGLAQALLLPFVLAAASLEFLCPYLAFDRIHDRYGMLAGSEAALLAFVASPLLVASVALASKWLVLGRARPGRYPLWGGYYLRWWFASRMLSLVETGLLADTALMSAWFRLLGARVGRRAHLGSVSTGAHDLVGIGENAGLGSDVLLDTATVRGGWLILGPVAIGARAHVGSGSVIDADAALADDAELGNLSRLRAGARVPSGASWAGSPARTVDGAGSPARTVDGTGSPARTVDGAGSPASPPPRAPADARARALSTLGSAAVAALLLPLLHLLPMLPSLFALERFQDLGWSDWMLFPAAPPIAFLYTALVLIEVTALRWLVLGRVREGVHATHSLFFLRKWTVDRLMDLSMSVLHPIYASLYVLPFYRVLGARVGRGAEISTAASVTHDLVEIGDGAFVADSVVLGDPEIRDGLLTLRRTRLGARAFVGNCALLPDGVSIPDDALVGCLSVPPAGGNGLERGRACLGSPAILLPSRQASTAFDERLTYVPGRAQVAERLAIEAVRILLPRAALFGMICVCLDLFETMPERLGWAASLSAIPGLYLAVFCVPSLILVAALKWCLIGRYREGEHPMWSRPVWLSEAVTAVYEGLPVPLLLRHLRGTPFLPWALRLLGARIGRGAWLDTTDLTEFDLAEIGDGAELNQDCGPQTHLFEDRVMKLGAVSLGARSTLGARSIALPGARLAVGARLGALSLAMKGETIPAGGAWSGSPARAD